MAALFLVSEPARGESYKLESEVAGHDRVATVFESRRDSGGPVPLVLAFHGYGDTRTNFLRFTDLHKAWPEAITVYPEGLKLPDRSGKLRKKGWQTRIATLDDRDLAYVDYLVDEMKRRHAVDSQRIYATGFSNGARLVFMLMGQRADRFAAFAPVGAVAGEHAMQDWKVPRPLLYILGKEEIAGLVEEAQETVERITGLNRASKSRSAWAEEYVLFNPQPGGREFVFHLHDGGHVWPYSASAEITRFFRRHSLSADR